MKRLGGMVLRACYGRKLRAESMSNFVRGTSENVCLMSRLLSCDRPADAITALTETPASDENELRLSILLLTTFEPDELKRCEGLSGVVESLLSEKNLRLLCNDNEGYLFTVVSGSKLLRVSGARSAALARQLTSPGHAVTFEAYDEEALLTLLHLANSSVPRPLLSALASRVPQMSPMQLVSAVRALAVVGTADRQLLTAVCDQFLDLQASLSRSQLAGLLVSLFRLGCFDEELFSRAVQKLLAPVPRAVQETPEPEPVDSEMSLEEFKLMHGGSVPSPDILKQSDIHRQTAPGFDEAEPLFAEEYLEVLEVVVTQLSSDTLSVNRLFVNVLEGIYSLDEESFIRLWLLLALQKKNQPDFNTESILIPLKRASLKSRFYSLKSMSPQSLLLLLRCCSRLRIEDSAFLKIVLDFCLSAMARLSDEHLVDLFETTYELSIMFEEAFVQVHDFLLSRVKSLKPDMLHRLADPLRLRRDLFADSPLLAIVDKRI